MEPNLCSIWWYWLKDSSLIARVGKDWPMNFTSFDHWILLLWPVNFASYDQWILQILTSEFYSFWPVKLTFFDQWILIILTSEFYLFWPVNFAYVDQGILLILTSIFCFFWPVDSTVYSYELLSVNLLLNNPSSTKLLSYIVNTFPTWIRGELYR